MKSLKQEYHIFVPPEKVWQALVDPETINNWGGGPAKMDGKSGTNFSLWGGDVHGKNIEVNPEKKLVQEWYGGDWAQPSKVTFTLSFKDGCTRVSLEHEQIPNEEFKGVVEGWKNFYMGPIKTFLEKDI